MWLVLQLTKILLFQLCKPIIKLKHLIKTTASIKSNVTQSPILLNSPVYTSLVTITNKCVHILYI